MKSKKYSMILDSRAKIFVFVCLLVANTTVLAQTPTQLLPNIGIDEGDIEEDVNSKSEIDSNIKPLRLTPGQIGPFKSTKSPIGENSKNSSRTHEIIHVEGLNEIDPSSVGTLTLDNGGFGAEMWRGTPRNLIENLLPRLPYAIKSPVLRNLAKRLLLTAAKVPKKEKIIGKIKSPNLIALRLELLQSMGAFKEARELTSLTPGRFIDPDLLRLQVDERLYANDIRKACQFLDNAHEYLTKLYWQQLLVFCQTLQGDFEGAELGADLLAETLGTSDTIFFKLIERLTRSSEEPLLRLENPSALHLAAMRIAKMKIPDDVILEQKPAVLRSVAVNPNVKLSARLSAAEAAVNYGALSLERLKKIYMAEKFESFELDNALSLSEADRSERGRALLFQTGKIEEIDMTKAAVILKALEIAHEEDRYLHTIRLYLPLLNNIAATTELNWFAAAAARALYSLDRPLPARKWMKILRKTELTHEENSLKINQLWLMRLLATSITGEDKDFDAGFTAWLATHTTNINESQHNHAAVGLILLSALGYKIPDSAWWEVLQLPKQLNKIRADLSYRSAMFRAAKAGRIGETILLSLLAIGSEGPRIENVKTVVDVVRSYRHIGLELEARRLALELAAASKL